MSKKCIGCGIELQDTDPAKDGYTKDLTKTLCMRCFKMRNYGEYTTANTTLEYMDILNNIKNTKSLVLFVVDVLSIPSNLEEIRNVLTQNKVILVLNKIDSLKNSITDKKLIEYFESLNLNFSSIVVTSSKENYNLDELMKEIKKHRTYQNVYVIGSTNAGKSTLLNLLIEKYSNEKIELTTSYMPTTTLNEIKISLKDFTIIDTPGFVDYGNILNFIPNKLIKKVLPAKPIRPRTYQLRPNDSLIIENLIRIDYPIEYNKDYNSYTIFISNDLKVKKVFSKWNKSLKEEPKRTMNIGFKEDIVINGLGFIKTMLPSQINIYANKDIEMFKRKSLI